MIKYLREPVNVITHLIGAIFSVIGLIVMLMKLTSAHSLSVLSYSAVICFGAGMILLYSASATYHSVISTDAIIKRFKKLDHTMIFILIVGSYAPFCLIALHNFVGYMLFAAVASACIMGIIFKLCWVTCPKWISSIIYIGVGWFAVFAIFPIAKVLPSAGLTLLITGGIIYSIGGVIYAFKDDAIKIGIFGTHEIFHLFVMLGTLCHFLTVYFYIL